MYSSLIKHIESFLSKNPTLQVGLDEICTEIQQKLPNYDWVGFYFHHPQKQELHLKAFAGKPTEHTVIPFGKGICGQVALSNQNFVVDDVSNQDNYISCSIDVKSEIVIPLFVEAKNVGQIDIDSNKACAFGQKDVVFLEAVNALVSAFILRTNGPF
jgi:GAF domain-containing protein